MGARTTWRAAPARSRPTASTPRSSPPAAIRPSGRWRQCATAVGSPYPNGVMPEPKARPGVRLSSYDVIPGQEATDKLNRLIDSGPFEIHVARTFPLDQAAEAHRALGTHSSASSPCGRVEYRLHQT